MEVYISYLAIIFAIIATICALNIPDHRNELDELSSKFERLSAKVNRLNLKLDEMPAPKKRDSKGRFKSDK